MLVESLIGGRAPAKEQIRIIVELRPSVRIVVGDLVIVPGDESGCLRVQALEVGIQPILGIAVAVGRQSRRLNAVAVTANGRPVLLDVFVEVVAEEQHQIGVFVRKMAICGEITVFVVGARYETEPYAFDRRTGRWRRHHPPDAARRIPAQEPVPVRPPRL